MRRKVFYLMSAIILILLTNNVYSVDWTIDVTVAYDGSGDYTKIMDAINSNPNDGSNFVVFIKNGTYNEKIFITENNITLLGEDRDKTIITQAILRRLWDGGSDWGVATINIENGVSGLTLANLTVRNNFADLNPDVPQNNDHTMAIRGGGDKIIIVNCNIVATGGDTLSLWNTDGGRFYHSGCYFEGWVDYVCPRGYCYISNSDFFGHNGNASIWHDGSGGKDHKIVVRNSFFEGVENFGLGRFHRMSAFYLIDCDFSANLKDNGGINYVGDSSAQDRDKLIYGVRTYYDACTRETGNYDWHFDNLSTAENSPLPEDITDTWTFNSTWNPENEIHGLLECSFLPSPGYHEKNVVSNPVLSWLSGKSAVEHLVYFGDEKNPSFAAKVTDTTYSITSQLESASRYYWRVDEVLSSGDTIVGSEWTFYTKISSAPAAVTDPYPPVDTNYFAYSLLLDWKANALEVDTFHLYFGSKDSQELLAKQTNVGYRILGLDGDSIYYWRVDSENEFGITKGPLWYFNYKPKLVSGIKGVAANNSFTGIYPNPVSYVFTINYSLQKKGEVELSIYDIQGRIVYSENMGVQPASEIVHEIQISDLKLNSKKGHYFLQVSSGSELETFPFIIL